MEKIAFVFPGQGSQAVGMGHDIYEQNEKAKEIFTKANEVLGYELSTLCFQGPEDVLKVTYHTQPALLTTSIALWEAAKERLPKPDFVAGHSLGEYSALVAAGSLSFEDAVNLVRKRGEFMEEAVPSGQGAMAAVMGATRSVIADTCQSVSDSGHSVQIANVNTDNQFVISGTKQGVILASQQLKEKGAKRIVDLPVSGPFHSSLMEPAAALLKEVFTVATFKDADIPVLSNIDATPRQAAEDIQESLLKQVYSSVLWEDSIREMVEQGVRTFIEIGSGKVLSGLIKKIDRHVNVYSIHDASSLEDVAAKLGGESS